MSSQGPLVLEREYDSEILKAAKDGNMQAVSQLLSFKPELINCTNVLGHTPLMLAVYFQNNRYLDVMQWLLDNGASVTARTCLGKNVFDLATRNNDALALAVLGRVEIKPEVPSEITSQISPFNLKGEADEVMLSELRQAFMQGDVVDRISRMSNRAEFILKGEYKDAKYYSVINRLLRDLYDHSDEFKEIFKKPALSHREPFLIVKPKYRMMHSPLLLNKLVTISQETHSDYSTEGASRTFMPSFDALRAVADSVYIKDEPIEESQLLFNTRQYSFI